jgi:GNAT superfamily N-acetyltransferase
VTLYRALGADEIAIAADVFVTSLEDLIRRFGLPPAPFTRDSVRPLFGHLQRTGIFDVAEVDGRVVSICAATVREDVWFLSMFWTLPELQRRGVGRPLLDRVWQRGLDAGAKRQFVWSSVDPAAMATYMRKGMLPGCQLLAFAGVPASVADAPAGYATTDWSAEHASAIDRSVRGCAQLDDHAFWAESGSVRRDVVRGAERVGYFHARGGAIGPAAWSDDAHADAVLSLAAAAAAQQAKEIRIAVPGFNHAAIRFALARGLKLMLAPHLLMTHPLGDLARYVPSGPALF